MTTRLLGPVGPADSVWSRLGSGLGPGTATAVVLVGVLLVVHRRRPGADPLPVAGLALAAAALVALRAAAPVGVDPRLYVGTLLLAVGPTVTRWMAERVHHSGRTSTWWLAVGAVPGAVVVATAADRVAPNRWVVPLVVVTVVVGGAAVVASDDRVASSGVAVVALVATFGAAFTTLPDTEQIGVVAGAALPFVLLGFPISLARVGPGGFAATGLLAWSAAVGGTGRPGSAVGAVVGLGILLVLPVATRAWRGRARLPVRPTATRALLLLGLQAVVVVVTARVAGFRASIVAAGAVAAPVLALTTAAVAVVVAPGRSATLGSATSRSMGRDESPR